MICIVHIVHCTKGQFSCWPSGRLPIVFGRCPLERLFASSKKPSFVRKTDGISTEPDTWKGYENIVKPTYLGWPLRIGIRCDALSAKEAFQVGYFQTRVLALTLLVQLHLALIFTCLLPAPERQK